MLFELEVRVHKVIIMLLGGPSGSLSSRRCEHKQVIKKVILEKVFNEEGH
ncbi:hypothetical protein AXF42_Ash011558 [Apostasia shenzhenica]|uniref:Uncharacterized protein n=1 Tax=Apostasia shenzhenica TaxID=1088818 RepID=A0A2I0BAY8_9ASPA|nr:hypothetical protein AXF42_Ash011558 [Apostasia shenzhenica]